MADKRIWTAAELELLTPDERDRIIKEGIVTDLSQVPSDSASETSIELPPSRGPFVVWADREQFDVPALLVTAEPAWENRPVELARGSAGLSRDPVGALHSGFGYLPGWRGSRWLDRWAQRPDVNPIPAVTGAAT